MKIILAGATGQIGAMLLRAFETEGHDLVVLSRGSPAGLSRVVRWEGSTLGPWADHVDGADVVINLAGRSVNCRYTEANLTAMKRSRVDSTRVLGEAIAKASRPPRVWLQMSTATLYAHRFDAPNDEAHGIIGGHEPDVPRYWDRSIDIAQAWEATLASANAPGTRKVALRTAMVMSPDRGGVFDTLATLARRGLGGTAGDGRQFVSWIHERDFVEAVRFILRREDLAGAINLCAPQPLPNADFQRTLRKAVGACVALPSPAWLLEIGAFFLRTDTELILKSRRVVPGRLTEAGFTFAYPAWPEAAVELAQRWRSV